LCGERSVKRQRTRVRTYQLARHLPEGTGAYEQHQQDPERQVADEPVTRRHPNVTAVKTLGTTTLLSTGSRLSAAAAISVIFR